MRLGGYTRSPQPWWSGPTGLKAIVLTLFTVTSIFLVLWWWAPSDAWSYTEPEVEEIVKYYDIAPLPAGPPATIPAPEPEEEAAEEEEEGNEAAAAAPEGSP